MKKINSLPGYTTLNLPLIYNQYELILLVDIRERYDQRNDTIKQRLELLGISCIQRSLTIGDFCWIIKDITTNKEYILDLIIERKVPNDLYQSILQSRLNNQRYRLLNSSAQRIILLVEGDLKLAVNERNEHRMSSILQAMNTCLIRTSMIYGLHVQHTRDINETILYLKTLHIHLYQALTKNDVIQQFISSYVNKSNDNRYKLNDITSIAKLNTYLIQPYISINQIILDEYHNFNMKHGKSLLKKQLISIYGQQLMQIKGVSERKIIAILRQYPTIYSLYKAYKSLDNDISAKLTLLADIVIDDIGSKVGIACSKNIYNSFRGTIT